MRVISGYLTQTASFISRHIRSPKPANGVKLKDLSTNFLATGMLRLATRWKVPLLHKAKPSVMLLSEEKCVIKIPLTRMNKNHVDIMYIGALTMGAELCGGMMAVDEMMASGALSVKVLFTQVRGQFRGAVREDAYFTCSDGREIRALIREAQSDPGQKKTMTVTAEVHTAAQAGVEPLAIFELELFLKGRNSGASLKLTPSFVT